jgi:hypothetical protein
MEEKFPEHNKGDSRRKVQVRSGRNDGDKYKKEHRSGI